MRKAKGLCKGVLLQNAFERGEGSAFAVFNHGILPRNLAQRAMQHLVGHGAGEEDHQVRTAKLVFQPAPWLGKHLGLTLLGLAQLFIAALHAFVSADDHNAHMSLLWLAVTNRYEKEKPPLGLGISFNSYLHTGSLIHLTLFVKSYLNFYISGKKYGKSLWLVLY